MTCGPITPAAFYPVAIGLASDYLGKITTGAVPTEDMESLATAIKAVRRISENIQTRKAMAK